MWSIRRTASQELRWLAPTGNIKVGGGGTPSEHTPGSLTFWEKISQTTRWGRYLTRIEERALLVATDASSRPGTALEIGCEGGRWSKLLVNQGWDVICTDTRSDMLAVCQSRLPRAKCLLVQSMDPSIPCAKGALELLLCVEVDPVSGSKWFINEASRVLKPGGILVATLLNKFSLRALIHRTLRPLTAAKRSERGYYQVSYRSVRRTLLDVGFNILHERGCCWGPFSRSSNSHFIPFFVWLEKYSGIRRLTVLSPWVVFVARKK